jgi:sugar/nucleoside kinase (ribokinase family)
LIAGFLSLTGNGTCILAPIVSWGTKFRHPGDFDVHTSILLAAALPDDDFPIFLFATALVLTDMRQADDPPDTLYWNWVAFHAQYALVCPALRAALMRAFKAAELAGRIDLGPAQEPAKCLKMTREAVLTLLDGSGERSLTSAILAGADATEVGWIWSLIDKVSGPDLAAFRYLYERPEGLAPPEPATVTLIPWKS